MNNGINEQISAIMSLKQQGATPQTVMQMLVQQNPNIQQYMQTLQNMAQGKNPQEFLTQLAKQNGVNQQNMQFIAQMLNK